MRFANPEHPAQTDVGIEEISPARSEFHPALLNAPIAFGANDLGFSHTRVLKSRTYGFPTMSGQSLCSPVRELSWSRGRSPVPPKNLPRPAGIPCLLVGEQLSAPL